MNESTNGRVSLAELATRFGPDAAAEAHKPQFPEPMDLHKFAKLNGGNGVRWYLDGIFPRGGTVLLAADPKAGKTTFLLKLFEAVSQGQAAFIGHKLAHLPILLATEESADLWDERLTNNDISPGVVKVQTGEDDSPQLFKTLPTQAEWEALCEHLANQVRDKGAGLVIFDTLPNLWPVANENDAGEMRQALVPLRQIATAGACLLLVLHSRKSGGENGRGVRGSNALTGFVDVIAELKRVGPDHPRRRTLAVTGRYRSPGTLTIELRGSGYELVEEEGGDKDGAPAVKTGGPAYTVSLLPAEAPGVTVDELRRGWPVGKKAPEVETLEGHLRKAYKAGTVGRGGGTKGDPHRYHRLAG
jgi:hypothetical protein